MATLFLEDGLTPLETESGTYLEDEYGTPAVAPRPPLAFVCIELEVYQPGSTAQPFALPRGTHPRGALTMLAQRLESTDTLRAADAGYRSQASDTIGLQVYPAVLDQAFEIDRHLGLDPGSASTSTYGSIRLTNLGQRYDAYARTRNCDSRPVRILSGSKVFDATRGIYVDPAYASLLPIFCGTAAQWSLAEDVLEVPLRDGTYWAANRPLQSTLYTGAGGLGGGTDLTGKQIPVTRGGTAASPVQSVLLVLVDSVALIYQWTDGPGTLVTLYEGGAAVFIYDGDVPNLYAGTPPASGHYRTCNALGVLQLGARPYGSRALTADCTGAFPIAGAKSTPAALALAVLTESLAVPSSMIDAASFAAADAACPWVAGFHAGTDTTAGLDTVGMLLASIGGRLIPTRAGKLSAALLRAVPSGAMPVMRLTTANVVGVTPQALPTAVDPPPYRFQVAYARNWNGAQTDNLNGALSSDRAAWLASEWRYAAWSGSDVLTAYRSRNDPAPVETALLAQADAQTLATALGALWRGRPGLYAVEMPISTALGLDVGSYVALDWPLADLAGGQVGQVVGESVRSYDATATLQVLVP